MAITIADLIGKKDEITAAKKRLYDLETSIGEITVKIPTSSIVVDVWGMPDNMEANKFLIYECVVEPNLKDSQLQKEFGCGEPTDIVPAIFQVGEISTIATEIMNRAGFGGNISSKIHKEIKN